MGLRQQGAPSFDGGLFRGLKAPGFLPGGAKHLLTVSNDLDAMICDFPPFRKLRERMGHPAALHNLDLTQDTRYSPGEVIGIEAKVLSEIRTHATFQPATLNARTSR
jgi:hypothetical protein